MAITTLNGSRVRIVGGNVRARIAQGRLDFVPRSIPISFDDLIATGGEQEIVDAVNARNARDAAPPLDFGDVMSL